MAAPFRVAVLESDDDIRGLLVELFSTAGFEVIGVDAPEHLRDSWRGDVVMSDTFRHSFDEKAVRAHVARLRKRFNAAVVLLTSHAEASRVPGSLGADAVTSKPFEVDALVGLVQRIAAEKRAGKR